MPPTMFRSIHINIISCVYPYFSWRNLKSCQTSKVAKFQSMDWLKDKPTLVLPWFYPFCTTKNGGFPSWRFHRDLGSLWDPRNPRRWFVANAQIGAVPDGGLCHGMALHHTFSRRQGLVEGLQQKNKRPSWSQRKESPILKRYIKLHVNHMNHELSSHIVYHICI